MSGPPYPSSVFPYGRQSIDDEDIAAVVDQLRGDWLTQGPAVARFEAALADIVAVKHVVAVANGTAALHLACLAANVGPGDVGITSPVTFVASANAIRYAGGVPLFADVDPATALMSVAALDRAVTALASEGKRPRVIVPVDFAGAVADLPAIRAIADRAGAMVIEDAAHSLGASYDSGGRTFAAGSCEHVDMATLSFHPVKHITTCEGGAIATNDGVLYRRLCDLRTHGITKDPARLTRDEGPWYYEQQELGFNYRISDVQCALGSSQARKLARFVERRRAIAARYDRAFAAADVREKLRPLSVPASVRSSYHLYVVQLVEGAGEPLTSIAARRRALFEALQARKVLPQVHYVPVHRQPDFIRAGLGRGTFEGADHYYAGCLSLPMYPSLRDEDVDEVVARVVDALSAAAHPGTEPTR